MVLAFTAVGILTVMATGVWLEFSTARTKLTILHRFMDKSEISAGWPEGSLTLSGSTLYGVTYGGSGFGTVFRINTDGNGYTSLHSFAGGSSDGAGPFSALTLSGTTIYGTTRGGGAGDLGVVFKMNTDGSGYTNLYTFASDSPGKNMPSGSLTPSGSSFYGMTDEGPRNNCGTIFKMTTDGSEFANIHFFAAGDGHSPLGSLTLSGSALYGMAIHGGNNGDKVTVFSINTDGSGYTNLHYFAGGKDYRYSIAAGALTVSGSALYGTTLNGGSSANGLVLKINTDGTGFTNLHSFAGGSGDGAAPLGWLTLSGSRLYGMTETGGKNHCGVVFRINTDGSGYTIVHSFTSGRPTGILILANSTLYGMTQFNEYPDLGMIFKLELVP